MRLLLLAILTGCTDPLVDEFKDSSSAAFLYVCDESCGVEMTSTTPELPVQCPDGAYYALSWGRFVDVHAACAEEDGGWSSSSNWTRPAACSNDVDCQTFDVAGFEYECRVGLCQNRDLERYPPMFVNWGTALLLCYGPHAREATYDATNEVAIMIDDTVTAACPSRSDRDACTLPLPASCSQPF